MSNDLSELLLCVVVGAVLGLLLRRFAPEKSRSFANWSRQPGRTRLFAAGFVMFALAAIASFIDGNRLYGCLHSGFAVLQFVGMLTVRRLARSA